MSLGSTLGVLLAALLAGLCVLLGLCAGIIVRRRLLLRSGGTFDCALRERMLPGGRCWMLGTARYTNDGLEWFRIFSLAPRPRVRVTRHRFQVVARRLPEGPERHVLPKGAVILNCRSHGRRLELAMGTPALTGLLAWLESAPPGQQADVA